MTIGQALSNALSGLAVAGQRAGVTANNIANAQTEGYTARTVDVAQRVTGNVGSGVIVSGVNGASAPAITAERRFADGQFARDDAIATGLGRISNLLGGPDEPNSLVQRFAQLETSLRGLAETPDDGILQTSTANAATDLANSLNGLSSSIQRVRLDADAEIASKVATVNDALQRIEQLNGAIARGQASGADINALVDQRNQLIDTVNRNVPVRVIERSGGVDLITPEGAFLLSGVARPVTFTPSPAVTPQSSYDDGAGVLSGLSVDGVDITPGGGSVSAPEQGALAGLFEIRDRIAPEISAAADATALDLAERFSTPGLDATVASGAPGLFTDDGALAEASNIVGLAGRIAVNVAVDPSNGGNPAALRDGLGATSAGPAGADGLLREFVAALSDPRSVDGALQSPSALTAAESAAQLSSLAASARVVAEDVRNGSEAFATSLAEAEIGQVGVDTDTELQRLLTIEQAYAANARVIQTVDRLIQRLLEI